jgi:hypothetical protein
MSTEQIIVNDVAIQTSVAPIEVPPVEVAVKQTKEKKPKKVSDSPKLAPKFQKYLFFGYWIALQLKNKNLINDELFQTILTDIKMNDEVVVQTEFYTNYENVDFKMVSRKPTVSPDAPSLPAEGLEAKPKAKKSRKPTGRDSTPDAPSLPVEGVVEGVQVEKPKAAKKARKPKVVVSDATEAVPVEAVQVDGTEAVPVEKPKAKRVRKPKAVVSDATEAVPQEVPVEGTEGAPVEEKSKAKKPRKPKALPSDATQTLPIDGAQADNKPKAKKSKKSTNNSSLSNPDDIIHNLLSNAIPSEPVEAQNEKPTVEIQNNNDNDDSEDEDVSVSTIIINNEEYLIDDQFNLYHTITHDNIGTFINEQLELRTSYTLTRAM